MILRPQKKTMRRLREVLNQLYSHLDNSAFAGAADVSIHACIHKSKIYLNFFMNVMVNKDSVIVSGQLHYDCHNLHYDCLSCS